MPLLLMFELIRRLIWFVKRLRKHKLPPEDMAHEEPTTQEKAFALRELTIACVAIVVAEAFFSGFPYVLMTWQSMSHPNLEVPVEILFFPCHATLNLLLFGSMFY